MTCRGVRAVFRACLSLGVVAGSVLLVSGCSLVVDTEQLTAGDDGLTCLGTEKICPVSLEEPEGERACVDSSAPENGCSLSSCRPCEVPGALPRCTSQGLCGIAICQEGFSDCDEVEQNGCEVDLFFDEENCGACGISCVSENAVSTCVLGRCEFVVCLPDFADCNTKPEDGCEVDLRSDSAHCGECGSLCAGECAQGICL